VGVVIAGACISDVLLLCDTGDGLRKAVEINFIATNRKQNETTQQVSNEKNDASTYTKCTTSSDAAFVRFCRWADIAV